MPTRTIELTPDQDRFVEQIVENGAYQDADEAIRDAVRVLQHRHREDELKLQALRTQIEIGLASLERGDFVEIADADLETYLDRLA